MPYTSNWTGGLDNMATYIEMDADYTLKPEEKRRDIIVNASDKNLSLYLNTNDGEITEVFNIGENAVAVFKNEDDDVGVDLDSQALVYLFTTPGKTTFDIAALYPQGGE